MNSTQIMTEMIVQKTIRTAEENPRIGVSLLQQVRQALIRAADQLGQQMWEITGQQPTEMVVFPHAPSVQRAALRSLAESAMLVLGREPQGDEPLLNPDCLQHIAPDLENQIGLAIQAYEATTQADLAIRVLDQETEIIAAEALERLDPQETRELRAEVLDTMCQLITDSEEGQK